MKTNICITDRKWIVALLLIGVLVVSMAGCLVNGSVEIPLSAICDILSGGESEKKAWEVIVLQTRVPMVITAVTAGSALAVAGLLLQTCFNNPLAGPSILGVSTGASLGVAIVVMMSGAVLSTGLVGYISIIAAALIGASVVIGILLLLAQKLKSTISLIIVGVLISYFASSAISLLNYYSSQESVYSYTIWGLGSFAGLTLDRSFILAFATWPVIIMSLLVIKPLNALLLGWRYAASVGVSVKKTRRNLLMASGVLTALVTAFCGPIGFIGLVAPHVTRMLTGSSNHSILLPNTILCGGAMAALCACVSVAWGGDGLVPINAITPIIGVPIVLYVLINNRDRR